MSHRLWLSRPCRFPLVLYLVLIAQSLTPNAFAQEWPSGRGEWVKAAPERCPESLKLCRAECDAAAPDDRLGCESRCESQSILCHTGNMHPSISRQGEKKGPLQVDGRPCLELESELAAEPLHEAVWRNQCDVSLRVDALCTNLAETGQWISDIKVVGGDVLRIACPFLLGVDITYRLALHAMYQNGREEHIRTSFGFSAPDRFDAKSPPVLKTSSGRTYSLPPPFSEKCMAARPLCINRCEVMSGTPLSSLGPEGLASFRQCKNDCAAAAWKCNQGEITAENIVEAAKVREASGHQPQLDCFENLASGEKSALKVPAALPQASGRWRAESVREGCSGPSLDIYDDRNLEASGGCNSREGRLHNGRIDLERRETMVGCRPEAERRDRVFFAALSGSRLLFSENTLEMVNDRGEVIYRFRRRKGAQ
jgi:hypothetical protein